MHERTYEARIAEIRRLEAEAEGIFMALHLKGLFEGLLDDLLS
jgi:hypothetical protein